MLLDKAMQVSEFLAQRFQLSCKILVCGLVLVLHILLRGLADLFPLQRRCRTSCRPKGRLRSHNPDQNTQ